MHVESMKLVYISLCLKAFHALEAALGCRNMPKCLEEIALITKMLVVF